ncbi:hypothetical protein [Agrobacterium leguminum]
MSVFGTILPYVSRVISPSDADGNPAMNEEENASAHFEVKCWAFAWFGFCALFPFGDAERRMIDPNNPRQYAPGDWAA